MWADEHTAVKDPMFSEAVLGSSCQNKRKMKVFLDNKGKTQDLHIHSCTMLVTIGGIPAGWVLYMPMKTLFQFKISFS